MARNANKHRFRQQPNNKATRQQPNNQGKILPNFNSEDTFRSDLGEWMISFVSKLFSGLFVISLEIRLHKKQIHLGPMNLRYQTPSPNIFSCLHFLYFLFEKNARCATSRLTTTASFCKLSGMAFASLPMCQCAFLHIT